MTLISIALDIGSPVGFVPSKVARIVRAEVHDPDQGDIAGQQDPQATSISRVRGPLLLELGQPLFVSRGVCPGPEPDGSGVDCGQNNNASSLQQGVAADHSVHSNL